MVDPRKPTSYLSLFPCRLSSCAHFELEALAFLDNMPLQLPKRVHLLLAVQLEGKGCSIKINLLEHRLANLDVIYGSDAHFFLQIKTTYLNYARL